MKWQRYIWTVTLLIIWVISLLIVDSTARQTRMGYQKQKLLQKQQEISEQNLRYQCEISSLHNLEAVEKHVETNNLEFPDVDQIKNIEDIESKE